MDAGEDRIFSENFEETGAFVNYETRLPKRALKQETVGDWDWREGRADQYGHENMEENNSSLDGLQQATRWTKNYVSSEKPLSETLVSFYFPNKPSHIFISFHLQLRFHNISPQSHSSWFLQSLQPVVLLWPSIWLNPWNFYFPFSVHVAKILITAGENHDWVICKFMRWKFKGVKQSYFFPIHSSFLFYIASLSEFQNF